MQVYNPPFGGPVTPYLSDALNTFLPASSATTTSFTLGTDWLVPFTVREQVTIDAVWWHRGNTTAANVYVGIYNSDGALLTDCAVDADTTAGYHTVSTTPVTLVPNRVYYGAVNQSVQVASRGTVSSSTDILVLQNFAPRPAMASSVETAWASQMLYKARANAALLSNLVMSGWTGTNLYMLGGFVKQ